MSTSAVFTSGGSQASRSDATPMRLDASVENEVNALWRSIFERSHATQTHGENPGKSVGAEPPTRAGRDAWTFVSARAGEQDAKQAWSPTQQRRMSAPVPEEATVAPASPAGSLPASFIENVRTVVDSEARTSVATLCGPQLAPEDIELAAPAVKRALPSAEAASAAPERASTDESVSVFMQGGAVTISVRDADLREDEALRCAFETARTLTGERATLRALMLNGRTVYRQMPRAEVADTPTLIFAC